MEKFKVLKNECRLEYVNEYIIIDTKSETKCKVRSSYEGLKHLFNNSSFVGISPIQYRSYINYRDVSLGSILPLPL